MKWRDLPPLAGIRAFAAFVQTGGVAEAGAALGVSHAAVSQQLKALEKHLGVALLDRSGRALSLTDEGRHLADAALEGFAKMADAAAHITGANDARPLHLSVTPSFAASWLMPRLPDFRAQHPEINILVDPSADLVPVSPDGVDVAIRYGTGPWPGLHSEIWMECPMVIVASPDLIKGHTITQPSDLKEAPWLEEFGRSEGTTWLQKHGVASGITGSFIQVPGNLMLDGARDGQGVIVTVECFVERDLQAGRLVKLFEEDRDGAGYHIVTHSGVPRPPLKAFVHWLRRTLRKETDALRKM
ncbi:Glycine cleavage system transcriptional activator [Ascidiaceihabitans donghaensis]|uniref:Glycine cleavage system transcriptional activator n=1 Tax=Ascidiaceihabitans donghaensis TaxID=1510460 RepID=A0A2R8BA63_9RHOB|nr:LysR family transcriptional regulator [Ascidiaceihabitans donghaensis]SPH19926.1 Glycine cleavage system transcriptional activator [Ascidiaceihabitans donghaensis]